MKQKKTLLLAVACMFFACMAGCKNGNTLLPSGEGFATLQGTIYDATTGARLGGTTTGKTPEIQILLVQGANIRTPDNWVSDTANSTVGEYAFQNIPKGSSDTGAINPQDVTETDDPENDPNVYKIIVIKTGYQRFEGLVNMYDVDNKVGDIYLFPTAAAAPDYKITVVTGINDPATDVPVSNAVVEFTPRPWVATVYAPTADNTIIVPYTPNLATLTVTTDASGVATFAGASPLALGAIYDATIQSTTFNGFTYPATAGGAFRIGITPAAATVVLGNTVTANFTFQGTLYDAITGARIGGDITNAADLQIILLEGSTTFKPYSFIGDAANILVGEYAIKAPRNTSTTNKFVVLKTGYQRFEAGKITVAADQRHDIYLYPVGYNSPDYTYQLVYNGKPVENATVALMPNADANAAITQVSGDRLTASPGYLPSITQKTDANGKVTFAGSTLPLGASYVVYVAPIKFESVQLAPYTSAAFIIGDAATSVTDIIQLGDMQPGNAYGLYVTSISNSVLETFDSTGTLTITFSRPVTLIMNSSVSPKGFIATETSATGVLDGTDPVTETLSADGLTLTLVPKWATAPDPDETGTAITYTAGGAYVSVVGYPETKINVFTLVDADGTAIGGTVNLSTASPTTTPLYVTSISNADPDTLTPSGVLTISLSRPVTLSNAGVFPLGFNATDNSATSVINATNPVTETLSADGLTLTLTPNWDTLPLPSETGSSIVYTMGNATVTIIDNGNNVPNIFGLNDPINNVNINGIVNLY